jgi:hypothetical protein
LKRQKTSLIIKNAIKLEANLADLILQFRKEEFNLIDEYADDLKG